MDDSMPDPANEPENQPADKPASKPAPGGGHALQSTASQEADAWGRAQAARRLRMEARGVGAAALGLAGYGRPDRSREDMELLAALVPAHPRQFWSASKKSIMERAASDSHSGLAPFKGNSTLLRAGLWLASTRSAADGVGRDQALQALLSMSLSLPGKSPRFYEERARGAAAAMARVSASDVFDAMLAPAMAGSAHGALAAARLMPDAASPDPQEARRHTYGQTGFSHMRLHDRAANAAAIAHMHAQAHGMPTPAWEGKGPANAFFWIARRGALAAATGSTDAAAWEEAGRLVVERCPCLLKGEQTLSIALALPHLRKALTARRPTFGELGVWRRDEALLDAFALAGPSDVAEIIAYAEAGNRPGLVSPKPPEPGAKPEPARWSQRPGWALALLAGHAPDPAWMPEPGSPQAQAKLRVPLAALRSAQGGSLAGCDLGFARGFEQGAGAAHDAASLCKAMGHAWKPLPKARASKASKPKA